MRKRKRKFYHKSIKYSILWVVLIVCFVLFTISSFSFPGRGFFQDFSVFFSQKFVNRDVNLQRYDEQLILSLREENEQLRNLFQYQESLVDYSIIPASVVFREDDWENTIIINRGKKNSVEEDMVVVTAEGFVGKVVEVYESSSLVRLLTDSIYPTKVAVSIFSDSGEYHGILDHYDPETQLFFVASIHRDDHIEIGSSVVSNGMGNLFPSGIPIGIVKEVTTDALGVSTILKVESSVNFDHLGYVLVLGKMEEL